MTISEKRNNRQGMNVEWIRQQLKIRDFSQRDLANAIGLTDAKMSNIMNGRRRITAGEADQIRRFFGFTPPEEMNPSIAVVGKVGAGDHVQLYDDHEKGGGLFHIARPSWIPNHGCVAAQIDGSSAEPWALDGDIIFWRREAMGVLEEDLGRPVVAELDDGTVLLKRLASGSKPGLWSLLSINPTHPALYDVSLRWASRVMAPLSHDQIVEMP